MIYKNGRVKSEWFGQYLWKHFKQINIVILTLKSTSLLISLIIIQNI